MTGSNASYQIIYADPPWRYGFSRSDSRAIEGEYPTMSIEEICALQVPADRKGCALFIWATAPLLCEALRVVEAWGFGYRTCAVWDKKVLGMGYWFRGQHELLLVGTIGKISPPSPAQRVGSVITCKRGPHSMKPYEIRDLIASWYPEAQKLEMFARERHAGWDAFGNDVASTLFSEGAA